MAKKEKKSKKKEGKKPAGGVLQEWHVVALQKFCKKHGIEIPGEDNFDLMVFLRQVSIAYLNLVPTQMEIERNVGILIERDGKDCDQFGGSPSCGALVTLDLPACPYTGEPLGESEQEEAEEDDEEESDVDEGSEEEEEDSDDADDESDDDDSDDDSEEDDEEEEDSDDEEEDDDSDDDEEESDDEEEEEDEKPTKASKSKAKAKGKKSKDDEEDEDLEDEDSDDDDEKEDSDDEELDEESDDEEEEKPKKKRGPKAKNVDKAEERKAKAEDRQKRKKHLESMLPKFKKDPTKLGSLTYKELLSVNGLLGGFKGRAMNLGNEAAQLKHAVKMLKTWKGPSSAIDVSEMKKEIKDKTKKKASKRR